MIILRYGETIKRIIYLCLSVVLFMKITNLTIDVVNVCNVDKTELVEYRQEVLQQPIESEIMGELDEESREIINNYFKEQERKKKQEQLKAQLKSLPIYRDVEPPVEGNLEYIGTFFCTTYCKECNSGYIGTSTGKPLTPGQTAATKLSLIRTILPYGTKIYISGYGYRIIEDCGGGGNYTYWLDICMAEHGVGGSSYQDVWIVHE